MTGKIKLPSYWDHDFSKPLSERKHWTNIMDIPSRQFDQSRLEVFVPEEAIIRSFPHGLLLLVIAFCSLRLKSRREVIVAISEIEWGTV